jgi:hypothetical protein
MTTGDFPAWPARPSTMAVLDVVFEQSRDPEVVESLAEVVPALRSRAAGMPLDLCHLAAKNYWRLLRAALPRQRPLGAEQKARLFVAACGAGSLATVRGLCARLRIAALCSAVDSAAGPFGSGRRAAPTFRPEPVNQSLEAARALRKAALRRACARGRLAVVRWLWELFDFLPEPGRDTGEIFAEAAAAGRCEILTWALGNAAIASRLEYTDFRQLGVCLLEGAALRRDAGDSAAVAAVVALLRARWGEEDPPVYAYFEDCRNRSTCWQFRLFAAAASGDLAAARAALEGGRFPLWQEDREGTWLAVSALVGAAAKGNVELARWLQENGVKLTKDRICAMFSAACMEGRERMADWLRDSFEIHPAALRDGTALAAANGQVAMLRHLEPLVAPSREIFSRALMLAASDAGGTLWDLCARDGAECTWRARLPGGRQDETEGLAWLFDKIAPVDLGSMKRSLHDEALSHGNFRVAQFIVERLGLAVPDEEELRCLAPHVARGAPRALEATARLLARGAPKAPLRSVLTGLANVKLLAACDLAAVEQLLDLCARESGSWSESVIAGLADAAVLTAGESKNDVPLWLFLRFGARPARK